MDGASRSVSFFKVLLDDFAEKLTIPPMFVRTFLKDWKNVKLTTSVGKIWTVDLEEDVKDSMYFGNGWMKFVERHDLRFGYFLVFQYIGEIVFFVKVFDHSLCMKSYCRDDVLEEECEVIENPKGRDSRLEVFDLDATEEEKHVNRHHKQIKTEDETQQPATSGTSEFRITVRAKSMLVIPTSFLESNDLKHIRKATLSSSAGNWTANVHHRKPNELGRGWLTFLKENKLKVGDVCIFELVSVTKDEVHFFVTREQDLTRKRSTPLALKGKRVREVKSLPGRRTSRRSSTNRPSFVVIIKKFHVSSVQSYLHIPVSFSALNYISHKPHVTVVDADGKSWKFSVRVNRSRYPRLCACWLQFCRDKKLEEGDVCTFELVSKGKEDAKMNVNVQKKHSQQSSNKETTMDIIDAQSYELQKKDEDNGRKRMIRKQPGCSRYQKRRKVAQANSSVLQHMQIKSSGTQHFILTLKPHNFLPPQLEIPRGACSVWKYLSEKCEVKLVNAKGKRSWLVKVCRYKRRIKLGSGWLFYARDNHLKVGDACCFIAIPRRNAIRIEVLKTE